MLANVKWGRGPILVGARQWELHAGQRRVIPRIVRWDAVQEILVFCGLTKTPTLAVLGERLAPHVGREKPVLLVGYARLGHQVRRMLVGGTMGQMGSVWTAMVMVLLMCWTFRVLESGME